MLALATVAVFPDTRATQALPKVGTCTKVEYDLVSIATGRHHDGIRHQP